ncbi:MAG: zinc ribbon domain-containing protein [Clostridia bacterium]|nr:zinc ribbon domain-containing protein [Clostridia bacterium]
MYCQHCGQEVREEAVVCIHCGCAINVANQSPKEEDKEDKLLAEVSFMIPIVGLIIYCTNIDEKPIMAKHCGKFALYGFIVAVVLLLFVAFLPLII